MEYVCLTTASPCHRMHLHMLISFSHFRQTSNYQVIALTPSSVSTSPTNSCRTTLGSAKQWFLNYI